MLLILLVSRSVDVELHWRIGYPLCLTVMAICVVALTSFFRRIDWL